jgi:GTP pyrophosphokinase
LDLFIELEWIIENQQPKTLLPRGVIFNELFKSKMKRTGQTADADIHKTSVETSTDICFWWWNKNKLDYKLSVW